MPTAVALDDPECLKLKDSMETGFNPVGTMPTGACIHKHTQTDTSVDIPVHKHTNTNKYI